MIVPGISLHAVDVTRAVPAAGMRIEVYRITGNRTRLIDTVVNESGTLARRIDTAPVGLYEAVFHIGDYYRAQNITIPEPAFLEEVPFRFGIADETLHYHLPLKFTPWGFSLFRGA